MALLAKVITVSDGVVEGTREDRSGAALEAHLTAAGFEVVERIVTADGTEAVADALRKACRASPGWSSPPAAPGSGRGTSRPRARARCSSGRRPGLAEAMRLVSPLGRLSRAVGRHRGPVPRAEHARAPPRAASRRWTRCSTSCPTPSSCWPAGSPTSSD